MKKGIRKVQGEVSCEPDLGERSWFIFLPNIVFLLKSESWNR